MAQQVRRTCRPTASEGEEVNLSLAMVIIDESGFENLHSRVKDGEPVSSGLVKPTATFAGPRCVQSMDPRTRPSKETGRKMPWPRRGESRNGRSTCTGLLHSGATCVNIRGRSYRFPSRSEDDSCNGAVVSRPLNARDAAIYLVNVI